MSRKRVLYVLAQHAAVYAIEGGRLIDEGEFPVSDEGLAAFAIYLQRERDSLFYVLGDLPEEEFQQEIFEYLKNQEDDNLERAVVDFDNDFSFEEFQLMRLQFISDMANK